MNTCVHDILSINRQALRGLHHYAGFDFQKHYNIERIDGKFTINALLKKINNPRNCTIVLLIKDLHWNDNDRLCAVLIHSDGSVTTDLSKPPRWYDYSLETFYRKGDFEITRKKDNSLAFLVWQNKEFLNPSKPQKRDMLARFDLEGTCCYSDQNNNTYVGHITIKEHGTNRNVHDFEYRDGYISSYGFSGEHFNGRYVSAKEIIDKSGYLLIDRRNEWKRKAAALRAERNKTAYKATDNTSKIEELKKLIEKRKNEIIQALIAAESYKEYREISESLSWYHDGLADIAESFERFRKKTINKEFASIEESNNAYNSIKNRLNKERVSA